MNGSGRYGNRIQEPQCQQMTSQQNAVTIMPADDIPTKCSDHNASRRYPDRIKEP